MIERKIKNDISNYINRYPQYYNTMGIPYYFYSLTQKYNTILSNAKPTGLDIYCIDFNGIIHNVAQDVIRRYKDATKAAATVSDKDRIESEIISGVWERIKYYVENYKAAKYLICADGVAPLAKMFQQRKRRYLNIYKNTLDNVAITWDTNAITPGTLFMDKLTRRFAKIAEGTNGLYIAVATNQAKGNTKSFTGSKRRP